MKTSTQPSFFARSIAESIRRMNFKLRLSAEDFSEAIRASGPFESVDSVNETIAAALACVTASDVEDAISRLNEGLDTRPDSELPLPEELVNSILLDATMQHLAKPVRSSFHGLDFIVCSEL